MKSLQPYLKPLLIAGVLLVLIVVISWFAFPNWRTQPGGLWTLIGVAVVGIAAIAKDVLAIAKTLKELQEPPDKAPPLASTRPTQEQEVRHSKRVRQSGKKGATQKQAVSDSEDIIQELS